MLVLPVPRRDGVEVWRKSPDCRMKDFTCWTNVSELLFHRLEGRVKGQEGYEEAYHAMKLASLVT